MNKKLLLIIAGVAVLLCIGLVVVVAVVGGLAAVGATQPTASTGDAFMTALRDGDFSQVYQLSSPSLQKEVGSAQKLERIIKDGKVQPTEWSFNSRNVSGDQAQLDGSATFTGDRDGTVTLVLAQSGNDWKVAGFNLQEK